ncbi:DUF899 family protein [Saccharopolyspora taberi]|uniref:DUF899 family protein n=1 Tax=Saccharopolyspora taberi TaxID=60895 RepID=A0ABN3VDZ1_9PSEU
MNITFPGESEQYRTARDKLLHQEAELRRATEAVAAARRTLPPGGPVPQDYLFQAAQPDGTPVDIRLSELFTTNTLLIYSFMFPRHPADDRPGPGEGRTAQLAASQSPCPSCTALLDQLDGAIEHLTQRADFAVVARAPLPRLLAFAADRGWRRLRLLSGAANNYTRDYHGQTPDGDPMPMLNVFHRDGATIRHFWGSELLYTDPEPDQDPRHLGTIEPLWNLLDLTPEGRGTDWHEQLRYP